MFVQLLKWSSVAIGTIATLYLGLLGALTTSWVQSHVVYLHKIQMTWGKDLDVPEIFGFLRNQVTPFTIRSSNGTALYAWHILPTGTYHENESDLTKDSSGFAEDVTDRIAYKLLQDDPKARLIIHFHGAGGTVGSGYRCPNYRALGAADPRRNHVLTFDYAGFGRTPGTPSEDVLIENAISVVDWALNVARIPPTRILLYSQSLGTAVNMAVAEHYAKQESPIFFAGHILTAPFVDVPTLVSTYSVAGTIPILGPLAKFPTLFNYLRTFIRDKWSTKDRIASYIKTAEASGNDWKITILHAEDDYDIPWTHSTTLSRHAVQACTNGKMSDDEFEEMKSQRGVDHGPAGSVVQWATGHGVVREEILKYGLHDVIMGNPIITLAAMRIFQGDR